MSSFLRAAAAYVILIFAARFGMSALAAVYLITHWGVLGAAGATLAVTVIVAWLASWLFARLFDVPAFIGPRLTMGLIALLLLVAAEARLAMNGGTSLSAHFAAYRQPAGLLDLLGQLAVALIPAVQIPTHRKPAV